MTERETLQSLALSGNFVEFTTNKGRKIAMPPWAVSSTIHVAKTERAPANFERRYKVTMAFFVSDVDVDFKGLRKPEDVTVSTVHDPHDWLVEKDTYYCNGNLQDD